MYFKAHEGGPGQGMPARDVLRTIWQMFDSAIPLRALARHDVRVLEFLELVRAERQRHQIERRPNDSTRSRRRVSASTGHWSSSRGGGRRAADVVDAEARHHVQDVVGVAVLRADHSKMGR